jgi:hypothetical protein
MTEPRSVIQFAQRRERMDAKRKRHLVFAATPLPLAEQARTLAFSTMALAGGEPVTPFAAEGGEMG